MFKFHLDEEPAEVYRVNKFGFAQADDLNGFVVRLGEAKTDQVIDFFIPLKDAIAFTSGILFIGQASAATLPEEERAEIRAKATAILTEALPKIEAVQLVDEGVSLDFGFGAMTVAIPDAFRDIWRRAVESLGMAPKAH